MSQARSLTKSLNVNMQLSDPAITGRALRRDEIGRIWTIDRREVIERVYRFSDSQLMLEPAFEEVDGWPAGEAEGFTPILLDCFAKGGWLYGLFDGDTLVGAAVLGGRCIGRSQDRLQLLFFYLSWAYRKRGLGRQLFDLAKAEARARGAKGLYISATPSQNTVDFYLRLGCRVTREPDPALLAHEPRDIHLDYEL